ncbi:histidinol-phosphate transaminase [Populibacterium corticicola]|uniref:Aromatic amino acid aminotransferase n=1 Tax=Populibacterium corticicola TaxID=1812826 RepID=A0ABW5XHS8_9MICO
MNDSRVQLRSAISALPSYVPGARIPVGASAYKVSSNENPYPPLPSVVSVIADAANDINRYPDMSNADISEAVARFLNDTASEAGLAKGEWTSEHVAFGTGSVALLGHILQLVVEPGDEVVFPWRSFEAYPILTSVAGGTSVQVPLAAHGRLDLDAMREAMTERTRAVLVCTPNNPTGPAITHTEALDFVQSVPSNVLVVLDEAYLEFVRMDDALDALAILAGFPNVVVLRTFSKAYGLAGLRVGYAVARPRLASALRATATPFGINLIAQHAVVASLAARDELLARVDTLVSERERMITGLREQGWDVPQSQGNFVWLDLGERTTAIAAQCTARGLLVRPFAGEGIRASVGEPEATDLLLELSQGWV